MKLYIKHFTFLFYLLVVGSIFTTIVAQVTMGSGEQPVAAAILDIKSHTPSDPDIDNTTSTIGGMILPRVELVSATTLEPFLDPASAGYEEEKVKHIGLSVYNLAVIQSDKIFKGIYTWHGDAWRRQASFAGVFSFNLTPSGTQLILPSGRDERPLVEQPLKMEWNPSILPVGMLLAPYSNGGVKGISVPTESDVSGAYTLKFKPDPISQANVDEDLFYEQSSMLTFQVNDGVQSLETQLLLRQINYGLKIENAKPYMEQGIPHTLKIISNTDWKVTISDPSAVLDGSPSMISGGNNLEGDDFIFTLKEGAANEAKIIKFTFSDPAGKYKSQDIVIETTRIYSNCIITTGSSPLQIPIRKAYVVWANRLNDPLPEVASDMTVELVWQDVKDIVQSVTLVDPAIKNIDSKINIAFKTPAKTGNAVIAVKVGGVIKWSWHIWVTNYNPNMAVNLPLPGQSGNTNVTGGRIHTYFTGTRTTHFMDRHLGAAHFDAANQHTGQVAGLLYQWGRKDPMAIYSLESNIKTSSVYTINNVVKNLENEEVLVENNLPNAIAKPYTFMIGTHANDQRWIGNVVDTYDETLWGGEDSKFKTYFDPCPDGWRVPDMGVGTENPWHGVAFNKITKPNGGYLDMTDYSLGYYSYAGYKWPNGDSTSNGFSMVATCSSVLGYGLMMEMNNASIGMRYPTSEAQASSVRCIKEE